MAFCNRHLSPLQRRSLGLFSANLLLTAALVLIAQIRYEQAHASMVLTYVLATLAAISVIVVIAVVGRYLARETDEFVRMMVVQALLWGLGVTFVADTFLGCLFAYPSVYTLIPPLNLDLFVVSAGVALRIQMWRNR
jgi:VIT1/CCC1 family predicted Fe2+/Mn2+ transporter